MLLWKFLLSSLLVVATVQQCQPQFILPNTLQDSVELTTFTSQQSQTVASYTYQYSSNVFTGTPTALLSIGSLSLQNYAQINYLLSNNVENSSLGLTVESTNMNWQMLRVHFILHSRSDLYSQIGNYAVIENVASTVQCSGELQGVSGSVVYFHQILGVKANYASSYNFQLTPVQLTSRACSFSLSANTNTTFTIQTIGLDLQISSLTFDYQVLLYTPTNNLYSHRLWFDLAPSIYLLVGVSKLQFSGVSLSIQSSFDVSSNLFTVMSGSELTSLEMLVFAIGKVSSEVCSPCGNYISVGGCLDSCPASSYPVTLTTGGKTCSSCLRQLGQSLSSSSDSCRCPSNQIYFKGNCYSSSSLPPNCTSSQLNLNKQCVNKNILATLNCPANSAPTADHSTCKCNSGYESVNSQCLTKCPPNSQRTSYGICACTYGYIMNSSKLCESICPNNSAWRTDLNECRCNYNYQMVQGVCSACPTGQVYDSATGSCLVVYNAVSSQDDVVGITSVCNLYQIYENGKCVCNSNSIDSNGNCYPCPSFTFKSGNTCLNCPAYCQTCQSTTLCLSCQTGFNAINNICQEKCGDGRRFVVQCDDGNTRNGDGCSSDCKIENGWLCTGGSAISTDSCQRSSTGNSMRIAVAQGYPRYISSGILISFVVNPPIIRSQSQLDNLFNLQFQNAQSKPNTIYLSQNQNDPASISCLFLYHNDLPNLSFSVTFTVTDQTRGSAHVTWLFDTISNGITAAIQRPTSTDILN